MNPEVDDFFFLQNPIHSQPTAPIVTLKPVTHQGDVDAQETVDSEPPAQPQTMDPDTLAMLTERRNKLAEELMLLREAFQKRLLTLATKG